MGHGRRLHRHRSRRRGSSACPRISASARSAFAYFQNPVLNHTARMPIDFAPATSATTSSPTWTTSSAVSESSSSHLENRPIRFPNADLVGENPNVKGLANPQAVLDRAKETASGAPRVRDEAHAVASVLEGAQRLPDFCIESRQPELDRGTEGLLDRSEEILSALAHSEKPEIGPSLFLNREIPEIVPSPKEEVRLGVVCAGQKRSIHRKARSLERLRGSIDPDLPHLLVVDVTDCRDLYHGPPPIKCHALDRHRSPRCRR